MKLVVPNEIRYGLQERYDTYTKKLGFMIYANKPNGTYGQQVSFDGWRDKKFEPKDIDNGYQMGFVLNKGHLNKYHFGASAKFRVFHPKGFEFEISLENLSLLLDNSVISYGEIQVPCCIAWEGSNVYLLPKIDLKDKVEVEYFDVLASKNKAENRLNKINSSGKAIPVRSLTSGKIVEDKDGNRFVVSSPTKSNYHRESLISMLVKQTTEGFKLMCSLGQGYHASFNEDFNKMFYPLTNIETVIFKDQENQFFKFVEKAELTKSELKNLELLNSQVVVQFNQNQNFVPLQTDKNSIKTFLQQVIKNYKDEKLSDFNENNGSVFILNEIVKIKDQLFNIVIGHNYRFGYGKYVFEERMKSLYEEVRKLSYSHYNNATKSISMYLIPLTSENTQKYEGFEYKNQNQNRQMMSFSIHSVEPKAPVEAKDIFEKINEEVVQGLSELLSPVTQEEIDKQKRLYLEQ